MDEMDEIWPDGFFWTNFPDGSRAVYAAYAAQKTGPGTRPGFHNREMEAMGLEPMTSRV